MKWNEVLWIKTSRQGKFQETVEMENRGHKKFLELKYNENVVNINYAGHIYK